MTIRRHHDMGGLDAGAVENSEHDYAMWEKRVDAIVKVLSTPERKLLSTDELRRGIEELGPGVYEELGYYERWISSATNILLEKGVFTVDELATKMAEVEARWTADRGDVS
jgi:hypothetical protein